MPLPCLLWQFSNFNYNRGYSNGWHLTYAVSCLRMTLQERPYHPHLVGKETGMPRGYKTCLKSYNSIFKVFSPTWKAKQQSGGRVKRDLPPLGLFPKLLQQPGLDQAETKSPELHVDVPCWAVAQALQPLSPASWDALAEKWMGSKVAGFKPAIELGMLASQMAASQSLPQRGCCASVPLHQQLLSNPAEAQKPHLSVASLPCTPRESDSVNQKHFNTSSSGLFPQTFSEFHRCLEKGFFCFLWMLWRNLIL